MQPLLKRSLSFWTIFWIAGIAILIDAFLMHSHLFVLGFDVPENAEYFISKFLIVSFTLVAVIYKFGYKFKSGLLASILGSSIFSVYYLITRPSIFGDGIYNSGSEYQTVYDLPTSITIWVIHTIAILIGFVVVTRFMKR